MIERILEPILINKLNSGKIIVLIGPRQAGKTTLLQSILQKSTKKTMLLYCDEVDVRLLLEKANSEALKKIITGAQILVIDEAQRVENIGLSLKRLYENAKNLEIIVSGSSALDLANKINEPLTGRKFEYKLHPFSFAEMAAHHGVLTEKRLLEDRLIYGSYPEIVTKSELRRELLVELTSSYLYKDIFLYQDIRKSQIIDSLLQVLALQVGSEVSINELSKLLGIDAGTVRRYIDLLEKSFVIFHLPSFSCNIRNELKKSTKIYFYDNGIRNTLISDFRPLDLRQDKGALWENYLIAERKKQLAYSGSYARTWFWRTTQQQEIDYIEESDGSLKAWEFKYSPNKTQRPSITFTRAYPEAKVSLITIENYEDFLL